MATFAEIKAQVSARLQDPDNTAISSANVGFLVNQALKNWKNRRFWFNEVTDTTTLSESNPSIPIPSDWLCPSINDCFVIEYSGIRYPLRKVSEIAYNAMYLSNGIGQPWWFSRQANDEYQVYPIPDRDYTLRRFYIKDYADLSADGDTNDFTTYAEDLLIYEASSYGSLDLRQDVTMYELFKRRAKEEYQTLLVTTRKDNATGRLSINSNLM